MGVGYELFNFTKKEYMSFAHMGVNTAREITGNSASSALVSWYLLQNSGDDIRFLDDTYNESTLIRKQCNTDTFKDVTTDYIDKLVKQGILENKGVSYLDEDDPSIYVLNLVNIWLN